VPWLIVGCGVGGAGAPGTDGLGMSVVAISGAWVVLRKLIAMGCEVEFGRVLIIMLSCGATPECLCRFGVIGDSDWEA
jgi:hypothetical protein